MSEKSKSSEIRYVGVKENLAYGFANAGQVFGYNLFAGSYLSMFFVKVFGIPFQAVSTMILVLGIWESTTRLWVRLLIKHEHAMARFDLI